MGTYTVILEMWTYTIILEMWTYTAILEMWTMDIHCKGSWTGEDAGQEWRKELQGGGSPYER